jgi:PPOX class probable F420-dependent enzyme
MNHAQVLQNAPYVSLATYRKSGASVPTPVWCAGDDKALYVFSAAGAGKIKRLRNSDKGQLAVCDVRGKLLGEWIDVTANIVTDPDAVLHALTALRKKYGWQMWLADVGARLTGKFNKRAYICITPSA